ncbi:DUF3363 domain-containing protein [uncultured Erythrobacter sp.]|uniref:DUF3363 domain-containing protein n=1 Tax=uncultured Erythrobacter sp. TaxID=263913 RepID=UPI002623623D|nr:DUF3363 domain-containing protein [uncultured Erythrobacter sp.]
MKSAVSRTAKSIGGAGKGTGFTGTRIGRGAGVGHASAARHAFAGQRSRRVVIKVNIARAAKSGGGALRAHVHYIQRDGVERDGTPGQLYDRSSDEADGKDFVERSCDDRHQFRLIVSPEDAEDLDLRRFTRELMDRAERDLGARLDWVAANHFNTDNPHTHIIIRGRETSGKDLVIAKDYLTHGFRRRGAEIATEELGPRRDNDIAMIRQREVQQDRWTGLDRDLTDFASDGVVSIGKTCGSFDRFRRTLMTGRLQKLEGLGLAKAEVANRWRLSPDLEPTLRRMGRRGDIIRTMTRAVGAQHRAGFAIFDPGDPAQKPVLGCIASSGGTDELKNGRYLIIDGMDGRTWHVDIGSRDPGTLPSDGAIVEIATAHPEPKRADRTIAEIAARHGERYSDAIHAQHDPTSSDQYRLAHIRRLEALRRVGIADRAADGAWTIPNDYLDQATAFEARRGSGIALTVRSWLPLEQLVQRDAVTMLDNANRLPVGSGRGFAKEVENARARRQAWLVSRGLLSNVEDSLNQHQCEQLTHREILSTGERLSVSLKKPFVASQAGDRIEGRFTKAVDLASGRYAIVERAKDFTLVPWREALEKRRGQTVAGLMRASGVTWQFGRTRGRGI